METLRSKQVQCHSLSMCCFVVNTFTCSFLKFHSYFSGGLSPCVNNVLFLMLDLGHTVTASCMVCLCQPVIWCIHRLSHRNWTEQVASSV